jgi:type II secretory pathway component GspD/PulD (secretin)
MKKLTCLLVALNLIMLSGFAAAENGALEEITLSHLEATDAYQTLKNDFPELADIVRSIQIDKNSISINRDHPKAAAFRKSLAQLDLEPKHILLQIKVTEVNESTGTERVVSRPSLFTLERQPATISVPSSNGKEMKITIIARSVPVIAKK